MRLKLVGSLILLVLVVGATVQFAATRRHSALIKDSDPITGEWDVSFFVNGTTTPASFKFKLDDDKVTGTAESAHTGLGTIRDGLWKDNKLSFALDFKSHESITVTGSLKEGKLAGEFSTEGFTSTWEAKKKDAAAAKSAHASTSTPSTLGRLHRLLYNLFH